MVRCRDEFTSNIHYLLHTYRLMAPACVIFFAPEYIHPLSTSGRHRHPSIFLMSFLLIVKCPQNLCTIQPASAFILIHMSQFSCELATGHLDLLLNLVYS